MVSKLWIKVVTLLSILSMSTYCLCTVAKYTSDLGYQQDNARVAKFSVSLDGFDTNTIHYEAYGTTKLADIEYDTTTNTYEGNSFIEGAYQSHTFVIENDSEVAVNANIDYVFSNNDDRVFMTIIDGASRNILRDMYNIKRSLSDTDISTVRTVVSALRPTTLVIGPNKRKVYTVVLWCEHDAVFSDMDNNGVADENGLRLAELAEGIPTEEVTFNVSLEQGV